MDELDSDVVRDFVDVARSYCGLVDQIDKLTEAEFLHGVARLVPLTYARAQLLKWPWHYEGDEDDDDDELPDLPSRPEIALPRGGGHEWWKCLCDLIGKKLSWHRIFHFVYDPAHPNEHDVIYGDLADCLADIYIDLRTGLLFYDRGTIADRAEAVWSWKFRAEWHWGTRAAEVMLPIHHLLHTHYDEDEGTFRT